MPLNANLITNFVPLAHQLADRSAGVIRRYFRAHANNEDKADASPVTIADREAESVMREIIGRSYPNHAILGEEHGASDSNSDFCWVLDPIDGTKNFMTGQPIFGTLIALLYQGIPIIGIINQPISNERWVGIKGHPSHFNNAPAHVRPAPSLSKAMMSTTSPYLFKGDRKKHFAALRKAVRYTIYGSDCYAYAMLASGHLDLVVESGLKSHDVMALIPVIEGAGGIVTDWQGHPITLRHDSIDMIAASSVEIYKEALAILQVPIQ